MSQYFTRDTDIAIEKFINTSGSLEKHVIFNNDIRPAFEQLIESLIYTYGFYYIDDVDTLKSDCLTNLYEMIPKYDPTRGTKGFSYFNVIAKNWFIQKTKERNRHGRLESELYLGLDHEMAKTDPAFLLSPFEKQIEEKEFWVTMVEQFDDWKERLPKESERKVLAAVVFLLKNCDMVSIYNKKAVYLYLRELTGLNQKQVVVSLKKIKDLYTEWKRTYTSEDYDDGQGG